jgi:enamine deaminase RidA (YjgF/YER057c/UK114 family)
MKRRDYWDEQETIVIKPINPDTMKPPVSRYSHGIEVGSGARWLHVSGQTASATSGEVPADFGEQADQALARVGAVLSGAGMAKKDLVKLTVFSTIPGLEALKAYRDRRDEWLEGNAPASTYVVVTALALPELHIEIEAIAACAA